jgi:DNA polymerase III epsilon subunit family exonuclease
LHTLLADAELVVFDIETTGGNPSRNGITEICALKIKDGVVADRFYSLVNPRIPIPPIVRRMTGIDNRMVANAPLIEEVMPRFVEFVGDRVLVSHNTLGDMKFLRHFSRQACGREMANFFLCTHLLTEKMISDAPDKSLKGLSRQFKLSRSDVHRAEADAFLTWELLQILIGRLRERGIEFIDDAIRVQGDMESGMRLGWAIPAADFSNLPRRPGVFSLLDRERKVIFLSSAISLDREFQRLRRFSQLPRPLLRAALRSYGLEHHVSPNILEAMIAEEEGQQRESMVMQPATWHQREVHVLGLSETKGGVTVDVGPVRAGMRWCFGPVRDHEEAQSFLAQVAEKLEIAPSRDGLHLTAVQGELLAATLAGELPERIAEANIKKRSFSMLWRLADRRELKARVSLMTALHLIQRPHWVKPLHGVSGIAIVQNGQAGEWVVHSITRCRMTSRMTVHGDWADALSEHDRARHLVEKITSEQELLKDSPLSKVEAARARALLWWVHSQYARGEGVFVPVHEVLTKFSP